MPSCVSLSGFPLHVLQCFSILLAPCTYAARFSRAELAVVLQAGSRVRLQADMSQAPSANASYDEFMSLSWDPASERVAAVSGSRRGASTSPAVDPRRRRVADSSSSSSETDADTEADAQADANTDTEAQPLAASTTAVGTETAPLAASTTAVGTEDEQLPDVYVALGVLYDLTSSMAVARDEDEDEAADRREIELMYSKADDELLRGTSAVASSVAAASSAASSVAPRQVPRPPPLPPLPKRLPGGSVMPPPPPPPRHEKKEKKEKTGPSKRGGQHREWYNGFYRARAQGSEDAFVAEHGRPSWSHYERKPQ